MTPTTSGLVRSPGMLDIHSEVIEDVFTPTEESKPMKIKWMEWQIEVLSEAISRRYCESRDGLNVLIVVRDAFDQVLNKKSNGDRFFMEAIGNH